MSSHKTSSLLAVVLLCCVLFSSSDAQGRCIYEACNFNRQTTPANFHDLLVFYCRRCCNDIWRLNRATNTVRGYPPSVGLSPALRDAAEEIREVFTTVFNNRANRQTAAEELEFGKEELQEALESLEQGLEANVFDPLDTAVENAITTAAEATNLAGDLEGGWNLPAVIELMEAITAEAGYALEILEMIAAILLL